MVGAQGEDAYVTPDAWHRVVLPRRGVRPVAYEPRADAADVVARALGALPDAREPLTHPETPQDIAAAGLAALPGGPADSAPVGGAVGGAVGGLAPDASPLGAAAVGVLLTGPRERIDAGLSEAVADAWVSGRGLAFAVSAAVHLVDLRFDSAHEMRMGGGGSDPAPIRRYSRDRPPQHFGTDGLTPLLYRLRTAVAAASEEEYSAARAALAELRGLRAAPHQSVVATFLAPTEADWVDRDLGARNAARGREWLDLLLALCVTRPTQLRMLLNGYVPAHIAMHPAHLFTLAEGLGADGLPAFEEMLGNGAATWGDGDRLLLTAVAAVPTDEAFLELLGRAGTRDGARALTEAAERFPRRALRLLAPAAGGGSRAALLTDLLRTRVVHDRALAAEVAAELPEAAARRITTIAARLDAVAEAPAEALPPLLAAPPWADRRRAAKPAVVAGLACTDEPALAWADGEREAWLRRGERHRSRGLRDVERTAVKLRIGRASWYEAIAFFMAAPEELAVPLLDKWDPEHVWEAEEWLAAMVARFGLTALPVVLRTAGHGAATVAQVLLPFTGAQVAELMAQWHARLKSARPAATLWLRRHPDAAARALVPPALGKAGAARRQAEGALRVIAAAGHRDAVEAAARGYGAPAAEAIAALLDADPLRLLPARMPTVPDWADPRVLAPIELEGGAGSLPAAAAGHVLTMLAMSRLGEPYAGLAVVQRACTRRSLAEFAWSLFQRWQHAGAPPRESWVLDSLGFLGDDETVRRLAPVIRAWPGEGGHARAVAALEVLGEIGSDVALMHLQGIAEKVKFRGLKERAQEKIVEVADALGLSPEQLADRLVPDFGLDPDGTLGLDYGPRRFVVGFDEQLKPFVADEDGKRRKDLPKPGAKDDPQLAPAAAARFAALKKDVRTAAADQIRRFERAMVWQRRWTAEEFRRFIVEHPLVWHVARRLVWAVFDQTGAVVASLRVAEDRSLAGVDDEAAELPDGALVGVAHPLQLGDAVGGWAEVFADYEILQPFEQLGRETHALGDEERAAPALTRFVGVKVPTTKVLGLERRGWRRADAQDGGVQPNLQRDLPSGDTFMLDLDPGIVVGDVTMLGEQSLQEGYVLPAGHYSWERRGGRRLGVVDPITMSEIIRDLREVVQ